MSEGISKPAITATTHNLPFDQLSGEKFEQLCLWLVRREGYQRVEHLGAAGSEQGRDVVAWRDDEQWAFQCKNVQRFGPSQAREEVDKVLALPQAERPAGLVFLVTCRVSANTRQAAQEHCAGAMACHFWAYTELDERVRRHPDIVQSFFHAAPGVPTQGLALPPEERHRLLAAYRQHVMAETRQVELAGIPLPRDRAGRTIPLEIPLDRVYIRIQALAEERRHAEEAAEKQTLEKRAARPASLARRIRPRLFRRRVAEGAHQAPEARGAPGVLAMLRTLGEYFYRRGEVYRAEARPEPIDPEAALAQHGRLVLLGAPGSGKTTLLSYLARRTARDAEDSVPILVPLREYATHRADGGRDNLQDFALDRVAGRAERAFQGPTSGDGMSQSGALREALDDAVSAGRVLWLVDALDEARGWRTEAAREAARLPGRLVLTSRPAGYERTGLGGLRHFEVLALSPEDTEAFSRNWFGLLAERRGADEAWVAARVDWLQEQLARRPRIAPLTRNPLLLTFLVVLAGEEQARELPMLRPELYRRYVEELLATREAARRPRAGMEGQPAFELGSLAGDEARAAALTGFDRLGWRLHLTYYGGQVGSLPVRENLVDDLAVVLGEEWKLSGGQAETLAGAVVDFWLEAGLLDRWRLAGQEYLAFRHLTFQEYAAARILAGLWLEGEKRAWRFLRPRLHHYAWREVVLLLGGMLTAEQRKVGAREGAERLVRRLLRANSPYEHELHRDLHLAAEVVGDGAAVDARLLERLAKRLGRLLTPRRAWVVAAILLIVHLAGWVLLWLVLPWWAALLVGFFVWGGAWVGMLLGHLPSFQAAVWLPTRLVGLGLGRAEHAVALGHLGDAAVPSLRRVVDEFRDEDVRAAAIAALGRIGGERAGESLVHVLVSGWESEQQAALEALGRLGESALSPLLAWLQDGSWRRASAARALGHLGLPADDERVVGTLRRALGDANEDVRGAAAEALERLGWQPGQDEEAARYWIAREEWDQVIELGEAAVPPLLEALSSDYREVREPVAGALAALGWQPGQDEDGARYWVTRQEWNRAAQLGAIAIEPLLQAMGEGDEADDWAAARALGRVGEPAMEYLFQALQQGEGSGAWDEARALAYIAAETGDPRILPLLAQALKQSVFATRLAAARALGRIGEPALPSLGEALGDKDEYIRQAVVEGLARIGEPAVAPLAQALGDRNDQVRRAAVKGLAGIGEPALAALAEALGDKDEDIRQEAIEGLTCIGEPALFPLVGALGHEDEGIRQKAEEGLVRIGEPALAPLVEALSHESAIVRQAAASILGQIGNDRAIEPLLQVLDGDDGDDVLRVVADALAALGWQPGENAVVALYWLYREEWEQIVSLLGEDAVDLIRKALREGDWLARRSATRMLGQYGESAVELLVGLLADTDGDVRQAAAEELKKLNWQPGEDADAASYWVALGEWDRASRLGQVAVVPLIDKRWQVSEEEQEAIMEALVQTGEPVAESLIAELVTSGQWGHAALVATLGQLGDPRAAEPLCQELRAEDGVVRRVAAEALGSLADRLPSSSLARRVARALWWRLTDWRFEEDELEPIWDVAQAAHYSLGQVSARLTELAVANLPFDDPTRPGP